MPLHRYTERNFPVTHKLKQTQNEKDEMFIHFHIVEII